MSSRRRKEEQRIFPTGSSDLDGLGLGFHRHSYCDAPFRGPPFMLEIQYFSYIQEILGRLDYSELLSRARYISLFRIKD